MSMGGSKKVKISGSDPKPVVMNEIATVCGSFAVITLDIVTFLRRLPQSQNGLLGFIAKSHT